MTEPRGLRVGYKASAEQFPPGELAAYAVRAEELGFDSVTISDHFQPWRLEGGHAPSALAWMPWVLARTERIIVGTSVMTPTFRYNPAVVAQTFATMACLAPGRVLLGVGTGEALNEVAVGAVAEGRWPEFKERFGRLREAVRIIRALWTEPSVTVEGEYWHVVDATVFDRPDEPVPIYVAAGGPMVARYAGRVADGFICTSGKGRELYADQLMPAVDEGLEKAGRRRDEIDRMIEVKLSWDPDPEAALENCRFWAPLSLTADQKHSIQSPAQMEEACAALPIEHVAGRWVVASRPEDVVEALRTYTDLGFDHLVVHGPGHDQERFLSTFAEQVLPGLRELTPAAR
jgi:coenzyme F420-dependent glucose-6-phosphate dehydrogenase